MLQIQGFQNKLATVEFYQLLDNKLPVSLVKIITLWSLINFSIPLLLQNLMPSSKHFEETDFIYSIFFACALLAQIYHVIGYCQLSIYKKRG